MYLAEMSPYAAFYNMSVRSRFLSVRLSYDSVTTALHAASFQVSVSVLKIEF